MSFSILAYLQIWVFKALLSFGIGVATTHNPRLRNQNQEKLKRNLFCFKIFKNAEISDETNFYLETFPRDRKDEFSQKKPKRLIQVKLFDMRITF